MNHAVRHDRPADPDELAGWVADLCSQQTGRAAKKSGKGWAVRCPAHEDANPSLSVSPGTANTDAVVVHCHAGCTVEQITGAIGITEADLFIPTELPYIAPPPTTVLRVPSTPATYTYYDEDGTAVGQVVRTSDKKFWRKKPDGDGWVNGGFGDILYNRHRLAAAEPGTAIFIVEGEKDADRLVDLGLVATCNVGGAGKWRPDMADALEGHPVVILPDNDRPGRDHANAIAASLLQRTDGDVRILHLPGLPEKGDVSDWLDAGHTLDELRKLYDTSPPLAVAPVPGEELVAPQDSDATAHEPWEPVDLTPYLTGTYEPPVPTVGGRTDGLGLFYPGRTHSLAGPPESGKTWIALHAAAEQLNDGHQVEFLDFENSPEDIVAKLRLLGVPTDVIAAQVSYLQPDRPLTQEAGDRLRERVLSRDVTLMVVDGVTNVMGIHGLNPNDNADVATFDMMIPRAVANLGPAVITIDHTAKNPAEHNRFAIGAQHKLGSITGAAYLVDLNRSQPFAPGRHGQASISISKDRPGALRASHPYKAGTFHLDSTGGELTAWVEAPSAITPDAPPFRPTVLMQRVSELLEQVGDGVSVRGIRAEVTGNKQAISVAVERLVEEGFVSTEAGPRGAILHRSIRVYREADDPAATGPTVLGETTTGPNPPAPPAPTGPDRPQDRVLGKTRDLEQTGPTGPTTFIEVGAGGRSQDGPPNHPPGQREVPL